MNNIDHVSKPISKEDFFRILNKSGFCLFNSGNGRILARIGANIENDRIFLTICNLNEDCIIYNPHNICYSDSWFSFKARREDSLYSGESFYLQPIKFQCLTPDALLENK